MLPFNSMEIAVFLGSCFGWIGALVLLGLGGYAVVRLPRAGYSLLAAGLLKLLMHCCGSGTSFIRLGGFAVGDAMASLSFVVVAALPLVQLAVVGLTLLSVWWLAAELRGANT